MVQVRDRLGARLQGLVIEGEDLPHECRLLDRLRVRRPLGDRCQAHGGGAPRQIAPAQSRPQHLGRMAEAHPLRAHHPVDHRAARLTRPQAVPEVFPRRHHEARPLVVVKRTPADQVRAVPPKLHARPLHQRHQVRLALDPLDLAVRKTRHAPPRRKACQGDGVGNNSDVDYSRSESCQLSQPKPPLSYSPRPWIPTCLHARLRGSLT